jgi:hypothetical protein
MSRLSSEEFGVGQTGVRKGNPYPAQPSGLDIALAEEEEILPSSGFLASVMERVQEEAAQVVSPKPISFPWRQAIPGILLALAVFGWGGFESVRQFSVTFGSLRLPPVSLPASDLQPLESAAWVAGSLAISLLCWLFSRSLTRRSGVL